MAEGKTEIDGFIEMTHAGHIEMLYRSPDAPQSETSTLLYETVERFARTAGLSELSVYASLMAESFFSKQGYLLETREAAVRMNVPLHRAFMRKRL